VYAKKSIKNFILAFKLIESKLIEFGASVRLLILVINSNSGPISHRY